MKPIFIITFEFLNTEGTKGTKDVIFFGGYSFYLTKIRNSFEIGPLFFLIYCIHTLNLRVLY